MEFVDLITVEQTFSIRQRELVLLPDFAVPDAWVDGVYTVFVVKPDAGRLQAEATLTTAHFNIRDPHASIEKRWRVTISLKDLLKDDVPIGSGILIDMKIANMLKNEAR